MTSTAFTLYIQLYIDEILISESINKTIVIIINETHYILQFDTIYSLTYIINYIF